MLSLQAVEEVETAENSNTPAKRVEHKTVIPKKHLFDKTELLRLPSTSKRCFFYGKRTKLAHTKWLCRYQMVFTPKYGRKVLHGQCRAEMGKIIRQLCNYKKIEITDGHMMIDHVHMLVRIPQKHAISSGTWRIKGKSSLMIFDKFSQLKCRYGNVCVNRKNETA